MRYRVLMMMEVFVDVEDGEAELGHDEQDLVRPHLLELEEQLDELNINMESRRSSRPRATRSASSPV